MSDLLKYQFELGRNGLFKDVEGLTEKLADVQPNGVPNNIRWQLGHILVAAEKFLFGGEGQLPTHYNELFGYGSKPSAWENEVPTVEILVMQLRKQIERIKQIPNERFDIQLAQPIIGNHTFGELASFTAFHELTHIGQIHIMIKLVS